MVNIILNSTGHVLNRFATLRGQVTTLEKKVDAQKTVALDKSAQLGLTLMLSKRSFPSRALHHQHGRHQHKRSIHVARQMTGTSIVSTGPSVFSCPYSRQTQKRT